MSAAFTTLSQTDLRSAATRISEIEKENGGFKKIYGGLCHSFPLLVRTCGLAQALAFHQSKAAANGEGGKDRGRAHTRLLEDFDALLPNFDVANASLSNYLWATRRVLAAWVFYKRFAVSILEVEEGDASDAQNA